MALINEIYSRVPTDAFFQNDRLEVKDEIEALLGKIRMIMLTRKGDLLGNPDFGVDLEQYIFETFFDQGAIQREIQVQFAKYLPEMLRYDIESYAYLSEGEYKDSIIIDILINRERLLGFKI
jgi:hypothetical protein